MYELGFFFVQTLYLWYAIAILMIVNMEKKIEHAFYDEEPYILIGLKTLVDIKWSKHLLLAYRNLAGRDVWCIIYVKFIT